ncbi:nitronate monooxygenase [Streptomyces bohaiensis]|uniref:nitronate monooxygenase n=1 Tax=Streptomyces bohaiensis TaxID=1431344 RepID=UPI003B78025A
MVTLEGVAPVVQAPMAGGVATPELVAAVCRAGGTGFLAGGYLTAEALAERVAAVRARIDGPFGVNLFVPGERSGDEAVGAYREELAPEAARFGVTLRTDDLYERDDWEAKVRLLVAAPVPLVSFTFGLPSPAELAALRAAGSRLVATVTTVAEAVAAAEAGVDALCVQGPEAGGHRATFRVGDTPEDVPLPRLVAAVVRAARKPVIAAGGLRDGRDVAAVLGEGAVAGQLGTAFLLTDEAGTSPAHRAALTAGRFGETVVTRAFSGRPARGLRNAFIDAHGAAAPPAYPQVHHLTAPLRAAASRAGDPDAMSLWAGTGFRAARSGTAAAVTRSLLAEVDAAGG